MGTLLDVTRRPETGADAAFRFVLFCESRPPHESFEGLPPALADRLMRHQFSGQESSYRAAYPAARHDIVEVDGTPAGRIVVEEGCAAWTVVDVAIAGAWRGRGIGTRLVAWVMGEAQAAGVPVRLRVSATNDGARRLYERLGFIATTAGELVVEMVWHCHSAAIPPLSASPGNAYPDRLRLPLAFDAAAMAADVERLEAPDWIAHFRPRNYEGDWSIVPLRRKKSATHPLHAIGSDPTCDATEETPVLAASPALRTALDAFRCPLQAARLMRLAPGSIIKEHADSDLSFEQGQVRLHVPITTNDDVDFRLNGTRVALEPGTLWYLRLSDPHSVANHGTTARVHLVIDALVNPWIEGMFAGAA